MALTIQERLKDLCAERGLTLEQLAEQTRLSGSAPVGNEAADILIQLGILAKKR